MKGLEKVEEMLNYLELNVEVMMGIIDFIKKEDTPPHKTGFSRLVLESAKVLASIKEEFDKIE